MDVIFGYVSSQDMDLVSVTNFSYEITGACTETARQYGLMVLRGPDEVVFAVVDGVR